MADNKVEITFDDECDGGVCAENSVLSKLAGLNYDRVTNDALIGVAKDPTNEDGYSIKLINNVASPEYLKEIPGYDKISQAISQTKKITDILPEGVSVDDYNSSVCSITYLYETLLAKKKRVYICYDAVEDRVVLTREQHNEYVEIGITRDGLFNVPYSEVTENPVNILFKIYNEFGTEKTVPVNPFYYTFCEHYERGYSKTCVRVNNPTVLRGHDVKLALLMIKSLDGSVNKLLVNKLVQSVETGRLTLYAIQYMLQEILYDLTTENAPNIPQMYLTTDTRGNLQWKDLEGLTLHSDGITIRKKNVFFEKRDDYGNTDYIVVSGFDFNSDIETITLSFENIFDFDENAMLLIADNQFISNYTSSVKNNGNLEIVLRAKDIPFPSEIDKKLTFTLILLRSSELEKSDFAREYITRKEAIELLNGERINVDGLVTDEKLDRILNEYRLNKAIDEFGNVEYVDVKLRHTDDASVFIKKDILVDQSKHPWLPKYYPAGTSVRKIITDIVNPYISAKDVTIKYVIPDRVKYTLYKKTDLGFIPLKDDNIYFGDADDIYVSFKLLNSEGTTCEYSVGTTVVSPVGETIHHSANQLVEVKPGMYRILDRFNTIKVQIEYSLPDMITDSYGELVPTEKIFPETHAILDVEVDVNYVYPKLLVCGVPFTEDTLYENIVLNSHPNTIKTMENEITVKVANAKYLFIANSDDYVLESIQHVESGRYITNYFDITTEVVAVEKSKEYTVREYIFGRDDVDATYKIILKKGE